MSDKYCIEKPEDFNKEMSFDKFIDEIIIKEDADRRRSEEEDPVRTIIKKSTQRPADSTRFRRK